MNVYIPREISTPGSAVTFLGALHDALEQREVQLDFGHLQFAKPFATLLVADGIRDFVRRRRENGLNTYVEEASLLRGFNSNAISYLSHVGFFEYVGLPMGKRPGEASGSDAYLPITVLARAELELSSPSAIIQDLVDRECTRLARMVLRDESQRDQLRYFFREIVRNVFEHADTDACTVMAQRYSGDQVEIAIADAGRGIRASLGEEYDALVTAQVLLSALKPGVTRVKGHQRDDRWENTGFGLYVCSRLARARGTFAIASSGGVVMLTGNGASYADAPVNGTAIRMVVNVADAEYFPNILQNIVDEGEREALQASATPKVARTNAPMSKSVL